MVGFGADGGLRWSVPGETPATATVDGGVIGQSGIAPVDGVPPVRYSAIGGCLSGVAAIAIEHGASVHMPRIGCGLAGGTWDRIEPLIEQQLAAEDVRVFVYDLA